MVNQSCWIVCDQSYIIHKWAEHASRMQHEYLSDLYIQRIQQSPNDRDMDRWISATRAWVTTAFGCSWTAWASLRHALKDMEWKPGSSISSCKYDPHLLEVLQVQQNSDAWTRHCNDTAFAGWLYTRLAYFCKTDGRCKPPSWSWPTIGLCSSHEHVPSTTRWNQLQLTAMIGYGISKLCNFDATSFLTFGFPSCSNEAQLSYSIRDGDYDDDDDDDGDDDGGDDDDDDDDDDDGGLLMVAIPGWKTVRFVDLTPCMYMYICIYIYQWGHAATTRRTRRAGSNSIDDNWCLYCACQHDQHIFVRPVLALREGWKLWLSLPCRITRAGVQSLWMPGLLDTCHADNFERLYMFRDGKCGRWVYQEQQTHGSSVPTHPMLRCWWFWSRAMSIRWFSFSPCAWQS